MKEESEQWLLYVKKEKKWKKKKSRKIDILMKCSVKIDNLIYDVLKNEYLKQKK